MLGAGLLNMPTICFRWVLMVFAWMQPSVSLMSIPQQFHTQIMFKIDIASTDLANITSRFIRPPYLTQEVIYGTGEPITPNEYVYIGKTTLFVYVLHLLIEAIMLRRRPRASFMSLV
jgi:hypothetical protein